jgi:hypothetical protein
MKMVVHILNDPIGARKLPGQPIMHDVLLRLFTWLCEYAQRLFLRRPCMAEVISDNPFVNHSSCAVQIFQ